MGRVSKKAPETPKVIEELLASQTVTQTRTRRTPKPNPKYANDSVVVLAAKIESSESNGSTDIEDKLPESKIVKSTKKVISKIPDDSSSNTTTTIATKGAKSTLAKGKATTIKKQKIDFDDDEEKTKDADEIPISPVSTPIRTTRSRVDAKDDKSEIKVGDDSVAIIDVSSIIAKGPSKETPKTVRGAAGRKRQAAEAVEIKDDDSPKKKKEDDKPSLITARKSYMPLNKKATASAADYEEEIKDDDEEDEDMIEEEVSLKKEPVEVKSSPISTMKTRRNAITPQSAEPAEKKMKVEVIKSEPQQQQPTPKAVPMVKTIVAEPKKLPMLRKEAITKVSPMQASLPTKMKVLNNNVTPATPTAVGQIQPTKPAPRLLNSMVTPRGAKLSPNVKLAGDGTDKKVFSIEMTDGSLIEKKQIISSPVKSPSAIKENIAIIKPQPSVLLKNKLESELNRMKASANLMKRQMIPQIRPVGTNQNNAVQAGSRRVTKFESWYVIDVKNAEIVAPIKHTHTYSLIRIGNKINEIQLPSEKWDYKVTLQKRQQRNQNNNDDDVDEIYTGEVDKASEADRHNLEPSCILFKRLNRDNNKMMIDRSVMIKQNIYAITMNGKQCQLAGAPNDIKSIEDLEILLEIIDSCSATHSCVESS